MSGQKSGKKPEGGCFYCELITLSQCAGLTVGGVSQAEIMSKPAVDLLKLIDSQLKKPVAGLSKPTNEQLREEAMDLSTLTSGGIQPDDTAGPSTSTGSMQ